MESFDNMLEAWTTILKDFKDSANEYLSLASMRVFNTYLQCHLAPPDGTRSHNDDQVEEIEDNEDNDRIKFRDQLQTIGMFGRVILDHSLPVLYKFVIFLFNFILSSILFEFEISNVADYWKNGLKNCKHIFKPCRLKQ